MPPVKTKQKPQSKPKKGNSALIIFIVIILILLVGAGGFFFSPIIKEKLKNRIKPPITREQPVVTDTIPPVTQDTVMVVEQISEVHKTESSSSVPEGFYIIVGSYRQRYNADNLLEKLKKDIEVNILYFEELGLHRVSTGEYETIHKAYNDLFSIRDIDGCENAWVLEVIR
jgi:flagellar basal body-associated protein FliL